MFMNSSLSKLHPEGNRYSHLSNISMLQVVKRGAMEKIAQSVTFELTEKSVM